MDGFSSQEPPLSDGEFSTIQNEITETFLEEIGCLFEGVGDSKDFPLVHEASSPEGGSQSPTCEIPCNTEWDGPYNFNIFVDGYSSTKKTWLYSHPLKKLFIDIFLSIPLQFKVDNREANDMLYVRALPVYSVTQHMSQPVNRCPIHRAADDGVLNVNHVVQCSDQNAVYEFDEVSKRCSVVVPLPNPPAGTDVNTLMYTMTCKTSCSGGMNRRPIMVIFTLEKNREVVGRKIMNVRICSCPKRDKLKEESATVDKDSPEPGPGKRRGTPANETKSSGPTSKKKSRYSASEGTEGRPNEMYNIRIYGKCHYVEVLRYLIMLKTAEYADTKSELALRSKEEYETLLNNVDA